MPPCFSAPGYFPSSLGISSELAYLLPEDSNQTIAAAIRDTITCINLAAASTALHDCLGILWPGASELSSSESTKAIAIQKFEPSIIKP
ncbi:hypothetical protein Vi05172_g8834 [Venturia inaequalis]|nr:hypothetical protein Vi05172_g8834 [Venturia inaequalis]